MYGPGSLNGEAAMKDPSLCKFQLNGTSEVKTRKDSSIYIYISFRIF